MKLSNMFKKTSRRGYISLGEGKPAHMAPEVPEGLLKKCNVCKSAILTEDVKNGYYICPKCQNYFRVHAMHRIEMVADAGTFEEWDKGLTSGNPLHYKGQPVRGFRLLYLPVQEAPECRRGSTL